MSDEPDQDAEKMSFDSSLEKMMRNLTGGVYEPNGDDREEAASRWSEYQAYCQAGFDKEQALEIVIQKQCALLDAFIHYHFNSGGGVSDG